MAGISIGSGMGRVKRKGDTSMSKNKKIETWGVVNKIKLEGDITNVLPLDGQLIVITTEFIYHLVKNS
jgi:hypothetical protein